MGDLLKNWKTSSAGVAAICSALADIAHSLSAGTPVNWNVDIPAIFGGIGLIAAKDSTTHSTVAQVETATVAAKASDTQPKEGH
jgi:hypothetical protein